MAARSRAGRPSGWHWPGRSLDVGPPGEADDDVLLILDEPTNHLDIDAVAWLEERLAAHRGGLVLVSHDRHVLDRVDHPDPGARPRARLRPRGWLRRLPGGACRAGGAGRAGRGGAPQPGPLGAGLAAPGGAGADRKPEARIEAATAVVEGRAEAPARRAQLDLAFGAPTARRHGGRAARASGTASTEAPWLFRGVDLALDPRERLGVVGPNGAGKSTLLDVLAGRLDPAEGEVVDRADRGPRRLRPAGRDLDPTLRVDEAVAGPLRHPDWEDARFLERFWFDADAQRAPIGLLSGGERRRLQLVLTLRAKPNVLLLDEPTNDLDLDTLRVLEDVLETWPGAVVVVSHDRALLERTVTDVLVIDEDHPGRRLPGGYARWEEDRRARRTDRSSRRGESRGRAVRADLLVPGPPPARAVAAAHALAVDPPPPAAGRGAGGRGARAPAVTPGRRPGRGRERITRPWPVPAGSWPRSRPSTPRPSTSG